MSLTYAAGTGVECFSFLVSETLGDQSQQSGNNQIVFSNTPYLTAGYGGDGGDGTNGAGDSYINRRVLVNRAGTPQERIIIAQTAGTGTTQICTVHEDWDTNPAASDTADVFYEYADIEDGNAGGGISLNTRTGLYELVRIITIGDGTNPAGLATHGGLALEQADRGAADNFLVKNNGYFRAGYYSGGVPINGGIFTITPATNDEPACTFQAGANVQYLDSLLWAQVAVLTQSSDPGASVTYHNTKLLKTTLECELYGDTLLESSIVGTGLSTEIVRVDASTSCDGLVLVNVQALDSVANTTTETIQLSSVTFSGVPGYVDVRQNKTWNLIDPVWDVTTYTQLTWTGTATGNELNDLRSVKATVQQTDGTKLQNALVNVYEDTQTANLELKLTTDANGYAEGAFLYKKHATNSTTTTYGGHALQAGKWLYLPFVAAQVTTSRFEGAIVLTPDPNIVQTTQATALTDGAGITWNEDANPSELIEFDTGSGTLAEGMILTFSPSGAIGTISYAMSGDSTAGEIHLKSRNGVAIADGDTFSRTGGTAGTFSGSYVAASKQPFSVWIDGNAKPYQTIYDYYAALTTETTLSAAGELVWEWCRDGQAQALYATGGSFYTETSNSKGIVVVNGGAGKVDYFKDNTGTAWTPPTSITLKMVVKDQAGSPVSGAFAYIDEDNASPYIMNTTTNANGEAAVAYTGGSLTGTSWRVRKYGYKPYVSTVDIGTSDITIPVTLITDPQQT